MLLLSLHAAATFLDPFLKSGNQSREENSGIGTAANLLAEGKLEASRAAFNAILDREPNSVAALLGLADIAYVENNDAVVKQFIDRAIGENPDSAVAQTAMGRYHYLNGSIELAVSNFDAAIRLDPMLVDPHLELGSLYATEQDTADKALMHYETAVKLAPDNVVIRYAYASVLDSKGQLDAALKQLDIAQALVPESGFPFQVRGTLLANHRRNDKALEAFENALALNPADVQSLWAQGEILFGSGKMEPATVSYEKALAINPQHTLAMFRLAMIKQMNGDFASAEPLYRQAIQIDPDFAFALNNLAFGAAEIPGRAKEALTWAQGAVELQPDNPEFQDTLAMVLDVSGKYQEAIAVLKKLSATYPSYFDAVYRLARLYEKTGDKTQARALYQQLLKTQSNHSQTLEVRERLEAMGPG